MINKNLINLILISFSALMLHSVAIPAYNGLGDGTLGIKGAVQSYYKNKNITDSLDSARRLSSDTDGQVYGYQNINEDYLAKVEQSIPSKKEIIRNINDVDILAKDNKLKITAIKFTKPVPIRNIKSHVLTLSATGDYFAFSNFLKRLETSLELYSIKTLNITTDPIENTLGYNLTIETYETNK